MSSESIAATPDGIATPNVAPAAPKLGLGLCLGWGVGTIGVAILFNTVNILLLRYMTDFLGIGAALAGSLLAISKIYDAFTDPIMGLVSDRTRTALGRRRPYMLLGGLLCAASLPILFWLPAAVTDDWRVVTVVFATFFYATAYTVFNVPYLSMASDMALGYHDRSKLMSFRVSSIGIGGMLAGVLAPLLVSTFGGGREGFAGMSLVLGLLVIIACWTSFFATGSAPIAEANDAPRRGLGIDWRLLQENRPFALLLAMKLLLLTGVAVLQGSLAFFVLQVLEAGGGTLATILTLNTVVVIATMPLWLGISKRFGKVRTFQLAAVIKFVGSLGWFLAGPEFPMVFIVLIAGLAGFSSAGMLLVGQSLLPDTIAWDRHKSGLNREGALTGFYSTAEKFAFALGLAINGIILGAAGYIEGQGNTIGVQPESAILAVYFCVALVPGLLSLAAAVVLHWYPLDENSI